MIPHPARKRRHPAPEPVPLDSREPSVEDSVHDGLQALDRGDYAEATGHFRRALGKAPFRADIKELLALALDERAYRGDELHFQRFKPSLTHRTPPAVLHGVKHHRGRSLPVRLARPFIGAVIVAAVAFGAWGFFRWRPRPAAEPPIVENSEIVRMVEQARNFAKDGRYDDAVKTLEGALRRNPADLAPIVAQEAQYRNQQGVIVREKRDYAGAVGFFGEAVTLQPENVEYRHNLGMALHLRGRTERLKDADKGLEYEKKAREQFQAALKINPDHLDALHGLARVSLALGDMETASATWNHILQVAPPDSLEAESARNELGRLALDESKTPDSRKTEESPQPSENKTSKTQAKVRKAERP